MERFDLHVAGGQVYGVHCRVSLQEGLMGPRRPEVVTNQSTANQQNNVQVKGDVHNSADIVFINPIGDFYQDLRIERKNMNFITVVLVYCLK